MDPSGSSFMNETDHVPGSTWMSASTATARASEPAVRAMMERRGSWAYASPQARSMMGSTSADSSRSTVRNCWGSTPAAVSG
ncbi:hypothetical protein C1852_05390 [Eggerthella lenta]|nr:hypothetical protein C1873_13600 [Eggerthella lenta]RDB85107.1 hypothetical protein C1870_05360 [Eggerthella lenta]RDC37993.1 hypothetical protein C1852_05390 [Eggerthella lenta]RDC40157.1 hypothetical protein C1853_04325 [Eggerthella lenta]